MESFFWHLSEVKALCAERRPTGIEITPGLQETFYIKIQELRPKKDIWNFKKFKENTGDYLSDLR